MCLAADTRAVERSDSIVGALRTAAAAANEPALVSWLRSLPKALVAEVGESRRRVGVVHGDVESLAGWQLGVEAMEPADEGLRAALGCAASNGAAHLPTTPRATLLKWCDEARVGGLLCTHTCLPFGQLLEVAGETAEAAEATQAEGAQAGGAQAGRARAGGAAYGQGRVAVFNNGSAGMANPDHNPTRTLTLTQPPTMALQAWPIRPNPNPNPTLTRTLTPTMALQAWPTSP
jgi:hypothetical protein